MSKKRADYLLRSEKVAGAVPRAWGGRVRVKGAKGSPQPAGEGDPAAKRGDRAPRRAYGGPVIRRAEGGFVPDEVPARALLDQERPDLTPRQQEASSYSPSLREQLAGAVMGEGPRSPAKERLVSGILGTTGVPGSERPGLIDATPVGMALGAQEALREGDYQGAALAAVPMGAGSAGSKTASNAVSGVLWYRGGAVEAPTLNVPRA